MKQVVIKNVVNHLVKLGFSDRVAELSASEGWDHFEKSVCNSRDPFKECCDFAGERAKIREPKTKYTSPKGKSTARSKKPQEAFNFR